MPSGELKPATLKTSGDGEKKVVDGGKTGETKDFFASNHLALFVAAAVGFKIRLDFAWRPMLAPNDSVIALLIWLLIPSTCFERKMTTFNN